MTIVPPAVKPARPYFSSGPCAKPPGWSPEKLQTESLGRSHRAKIGKTRLQLAIDLMREVLQVPDTHRIGIVPGSDTGAIEMAMWTMLGARPVTMMAWESFGEGWVTDVNKQLKLNATVMNAPYGEIPDLSAVDFSNDVVFTWNGTTSGARVPNGDWIADDREGLTFNDATSAVFAYDMPWDKLDVTTFSWQKVLGGEGAHGVLILGPRAVERLENYTPAWPLPKVFRLMSKGALAEGIFKGETINTPSMLAVEDVIFALEWAKTIGGLQGLMDRSNANAAALAKIVETRDYLGFLAADPAIRSTTSVCLTVEGADEAMIKKMASLLEAEDAAYDIAGYRDAPAGLRIWCGATVDTADVEALGPWLDWAYKKAKA
ncbi:MAG: phosphoserine aminotransferase [Sphingomonadales bacterium 35-56-22]|jgi:phosphoserine aminotransferase|uniref:phosphoserine transaminase n=1 Tax=Sphingorhabdus sp. TaxID=1902408 RepID=UPI000BCC068D|nr:phosphoserine transaminase [Sphingorhabdus sp.]OYY16895.1 MAG: phosphoserine aminotransferase [Sphingomonadales bacterium 35-56-22]OYY99047.1 MAG: phosphoserine aminotransferase [Sphingomonadales bacterium 28-56-43]OYZ61556.1 MAG: phosphoserine aminotransferase [Sphingomonadales bacterium 24-56-14]OZA83405.1 MAG: phosphoserine aminotransferase [Sphingomonadales bacterium 39-57-19]HQS12325.1 phosphoserine transaminase [Sphingorhabdus sp.]